MSAFALLPRFPGVPSAALPTGARPGPVRTGAVRSATARSEPVRSGTLRSEAARPGAARPGAVRANPVPARSSALLATAALPPHLVREALNGPALEALIHRDYPAFIAAIPAVALGSIAVVALRDRFAALRRAEVPEAPPKTLGFDWDALDWGTVDWGGLSLAEEMALAGVVLAAMAERLEHDPAAYPLLACAAARLVPAAPANPPDAEAAAAPLWTGLTERARRAAVDVLRPAALATLVRSATFEVLATVAA